jgi:hypothetical protein
LFLEAADFGFGQVPPPAQFVVYCPVRGAILRTVPLFLSGATSFRFRPYKPPRRVRGALIVRQLLSGIGVIVVTVLGAYPALVQEDIYSANYVMPGCRDFLGAGAGSAHLGGYCVGLVIGVARYAYEPSICLPRDVTDQQIVRV